MQGLKKNVKGSWGNINWRTTNTFLGTTKAKHHNMIKVQLAEPQTCTVKRTCLSRPHSIFICSTRTFGKMIFAWFLLILLDGSDFPQVKCRFGHLPWRIRCWIKRVMKMILKQPKSGAQLPIQGCKRTATCMRSCADVSRSFSRP